MNVRVIAHIDLDCFYAQVEMLAHPESAGLPVGVQQRSLIVTTNYLARNSGVPKMCSVTTAQQICPSIVLYPSVMEKYRDASEKCTEAEGYSRRIVVEKSRIDEGYLDLTQVVQDAIMEQQSQEDSPLTEFRGFVLGDSTSELDLHLRHGSRIMNEIRNDTFDRLGLTFSAGIAENKLLAKMVAGMNKPNAQTTLRPCYVMRYLQNVELSHFPQLGPRIQSMLQYCEIKTTKDLQERSIDDLCEHFNESTARWLYNTCRGIDKAPVILKGLQKVMSIMSNKKLTSVEATHEVLYEQTRYPRRYPFNHLLIPGSHISRELYQRMRKEIEVHQRYPSTVRVGVSSLRTSSSIKVPEKFLLNKTSFDSFNEKELNEVGVSLFNTLMAKVKKKKRGHQQGGFTPIWGLSISILNFNFFPKEGGIETFLQKEKEPKDLNSVTDTANNKTNEKLSKSEVYEDKKEKQKETGSKYEACDFLEESEGSETSEPVSVTEAMERATNRKTSLQILKKNSHNGGQPVSFPVSDQQFSGVERAARLVVAANADEETYECPICRIHVLLREKQEHTDYHYAVEFANTIEEKNKHVKKRKKRKNISKRKGVLNSSSSNMLPRTVGPRRSQRTKTKKLKKDSQLAAVTGSLPSDGFVRDGEIVCKRCGSAFDDEKSFRVHNDEHYAYDVSNMIGL